MRLADYKFMVVDKTTFACQLVQDTLFEMGARNICYASDVDSAMGQVRAGNVDFLICEHDLEGKSGFDLISQLRSDKDQSIKKMPIVLLTATTDRASIFSGRDGGVDEIVAKPFTGATLESHLEAVITRRRTFIDERAFSGPDRRRRKGVVYDGEDRRD